MRPRGRRDIAAPIVNLNTVADAQILERVFEPVLPMPAIARLAARELLSFLGAGRRRARGPFANVGAIARVRVPAATIDRAAGAAAYRERLRDERARAAAAGTDGPRSVSLLTAARAGGDQAGPRRPGPRSGPPRAPAAGARSISIAFHAVFASRGGGAGFAAIASCSRPRTC